MNKKLKTLLIVIAVILGFTLPVIGVGVFATTENKRTKDYKTVEQWALHYAKEDFFTIREDKLEEPYLYTIETVYVGNPQNAVFEVESDYIGIYKIAMYDDYDKETYLIAIHYNLDNHPTAHFLRAIGSKKIERIGKQHILDVDIEES